MKYDANMSGRRKTVQNTSRIRDSSEVAEGGVV
jgi:hypothetical protein